MNYTDVSNVSRIEDKILVISVLNQRASIFIAYEQM